MSKLEQILEAIKALLLAVPNAKVERNSAVPEKVPLGGLILVRDGDPGEPETALGGFGSIYYGHDVEIEVYVENGDAVMRDAAFDSLLLEIGAVLDADLTLGDLAFGMTYDGLSGGFMARCWLYQEHFSPSLGRRAKYVADFARSGLN